MKISTFPQMFVRSGILLSVALLSNPALAESCPGPSFAAARTFVAGLIPRSIAVGDFNDDGNPDLAVANERGNVSVLLGKGASAFQPAVSYALGGNPSFVTVGDFNRDGKLDLAVAVYVSGTLTNGGVAILLGKGDGTFQAAVNYEAGKFSQSLAVGDFNGDGMLDLAVASGVGASVLLGKGDGTFQFAVNYETGKTFSSVAVGDFNGDGKLDLVVVNHTSWNLSVLLGRGDGTLLPAVNYDCNLGSDLFSVAVGDFDGDGKLDLATSNAGFGSILLGRGDGTFQCAVGYFAPDAYLSLAVGDFNGDGKTDLAVAGTGISVLLGKGNGTFQRLPSLVGGGIYRSVAVGDFDGDGKLDLAFTAVDGWGSDGKVSVILGKGDGTFQVPVSYEAGEYSQSVAVGDFNGDGKPDLAVTNERFCAGQNCGTNNSVMVRLGDANGTFPPAINYDTGPHGAGVMCCDSVAAGDFNGDGKLDVAVANVNSANLSVLLGMGDGTLLPAVNYDTGQSPRSLTVGDFNRDGNLDFAVGTFTSSGVAVLLGKGDGTFQAAVNYEAGSPVSSVLVSDFNGDGNLDLAVGTFTSSRVTVLLGKGDGTFQVAVNYQTGHSVRSIAVGDFNGDGKPDLATGSYVVSTQSKGGVAVLLGNADGTFQAAVNYQAGDSASSVAVSDFNGDGKPDLAVAGSRGVSVLLGNGDGTFEVTVTFAFPAGSSMVVGDFNGDGAPDLTTASALLLNTCVSAGVGLGIAHRSASVDIFWPLPSTGFVLESTTNLSLPKWQRASEVPMTNNGRLEIAVPISERERYFHLRKP